MALANQPATIVTRLAVPKRGMISAKGQPVAGAIIVWTGESGEWIARTGSDGVYAVPDPAVWAGQLLVGAISAPSVPTRRHRLRRPARQLRPGSSSGQRDE
jgi:hypothetical protein